MGIFIIPLLAIFYHIQEFIKVGTVYEIPFQPKESLISNLDIEIDEERIKMKSNEILSNLFEDKFNAADYEITVDIIKNGNKNLIYFLSYYNRKMQEEYNLSFDAETGTIWSILYNAIRPRSTTEGIGEEVVDKEKLKEVADRYLEKIQMDKTKEFQMTEKNYIRGEVEITYKNTKSDEEVSIILDSQTFEFIYYYTD